MCHVLESVGGTAIRKVRMLYKRLFFRPEAREKIVRGAAALADAVRATLRPKSKCVRIGKKSGRRLVCNDGVSIAKEVQVKRLKNGRANRKCPLEAA